MVKYMFQMSSDQEFNNLYRNLKDQGIINFLSTSYIRGTTKLKGSRQRFRQSIKTRKTSEVQLERFKLTGGDTERD